MSDDTTINVTGLEKLLKALKTRTPPTAKVGIIGDKNRPHYAEVKAGQKAPKSIPTNAEVGAAHEFGAPARGLPQRSFLRWPIQERLQKEMESSGAFDYDTIAAVLKQGSVKPWLTKIAILAEGIVVGAFGTNGYGKWAGWKTPGYQNNTGDILVDTTQLRNSITHEVK